MRGGCTAKNLFFKEAVKRFFYIVFAGGRAAAFFRQSDTFIGLKKFTKVRTTFIFDVISLIFRALIASAGIEEAAVFTTMHIGIAMRTFIFATNGAKRINFASAIVTNHNGRKDSKQNPVEANN